MIMFVLLIKYYLEVFFSGHSRSEVKELIWIC